jgi:hypothetical protein
MPAACGSPPDRAGVSGRFPRATPRSCAATPRRSPPHRCPLRPDGHTSPRSASTCLEDQLGALGLVLNYIVLWNTVYINAAIEQLRAAGYPVLDEDVVRLHLFMRRHLGVQGDYSFLLPTLDGRLRELRDPTEGQDEDEDDQED